jgi:hypothetical protein
MPQMYEKKKTRETAEAASREEVGLFMETTILRLSPHQFTNQTTEENSSLITSGPASHENDTSCLQTADVSNQFSVKLTIPQSNGLNRDGRDAN